MWISPVAKAKSKAKHATALGAIGATRRQTAPQSRYEAADVTSKRLSNWITPSSGPNTEIGESLVTTRNRTRALGRDNPWAKRAVQAIVVNTVGDGLGHGDVGGVHGIFLPIPARRASTPGSRE